MWRKNGVIITNSPTIDTYTTPPLTTANITANLGNYSVVATDTAKKSSTSIAVQLGAVVVDPVAPLAVVDGGTTTLSVVTYGPVSYQWKRVTGGIVSSVVDNAVFKGSQTAKLTITKLHYSEASTYYCTVSAGTGISLGSNNGPSIVVNVVQKPVLGSISTLPAGMVGVPYSFTFPVTVSTDPALINAPTTFSATGLPPGLTINATTGVISGIVSSTSKVAVTYPKVVITASNAAGPSTSAFLSLTINAGAPPQLGTPVGSFYTGKVNVPYSYQIPFDPSRPVTTWTASGLPTGLTINKTTGLISGTPSGTSRSSVSWKLVKITATNYAGSFTTPAYTIVISPGDLPVFATPVATTLPPGKVSVVYTPVAAPALDTATFPDSVPVKWSATGLPSGLTIDPVTGNISGRPAVAGTFKTVKVIATNLAGAASTILSILVNPGEKPVAPATLAFTPGKVGAAYSAPYTYSGDADSAPLKFSATGLPPGLTIDPVSGTISGRPTAVGNFSAVKITLTNLAGTAVNTTGYTIAIGAFNPNALGTFVGLVDHSGTATSLVSPASSTTTLGARFDLTTTAAGAFTGKVTIGTNAYAISGLLDTAPAAPHGTATIKRTGTLSNLVVVFDLHVGGDPADPNTVSGTLSDQNVTSAVLSGWRNTWSATSQVTDRKGVHNFVADPTVAPTPGLEPEGTNFGSATVVALGTTSVSGKTAMGDAFLTSVPLGPKGEYFVYQGLYNNTGSLAGQMAINNDTPTINGNVVPVHTVSGGMIWTSNGQTLATDRTYAAGWSTPIVLTAQGGLYYPAPAGKVVMDLSTTATTNAMMTFEGAGLANASRQPSLSGFLIKPIATTGSVSFTGITNPASVTLSITNTTGAFSGTFTLVDNDPNSTLATPPKLTRVVSYQGLIIPTAVASNDQYGGIAYGYFLLPQLPGHTATIASSPILSGLVTLKND